ncbi:hypothetical protein J0B03_06255 [Alkalibacter rhizosphaerae]|uniref:Patatin-like phospholipase family protein n=1 Tax=Alkalibacter rhizosphaerae TaxID=2815577 RepID=A0A974XF33_9FIRM|nr:hypothetical protein [Alkalibacter rhizosphaerae]QSX07445.1 hypothetical protein J0B03_06255 [Alkalibacter rhizosphaerae]
MKWGLLLWDDGAKGAYEIGVWKGLMECRADLSTVISASASIINAALIVQGKMSSALNYWSADSQNPLVAFNRHLAEQYAAQWSGMDEPTLHQKLGQAFHPSNPEYRRAKDFLADHLDESAIRRSSINFILKTYDPKTFEPVTTPFSRSSSENWLDWMLIGFYYPIFRSISMGKTDASEEQDLLNIATEQETKQWVSVGFRPDLLARWKRQDPPINSINIIPSEHLGLSMDMKPENVMKNLEMGYLDLLKKWDRLEGKFYYVDLQSGKSLWKTFHKRLGYPIPGESGIKLNALLGMGSASGKEEMLEKLETILKETTYRGTNLPLSMLEITARALQLPRLKRYTTNEMIQEIFGTVNNLLSNHLVTIKSADTISRTFKRDVDDRLPSDPLSFLSAYVYFLSLRIHNMETLTRLTKQFTPETLLSIVALIYLSEK